MKTSSVLVSVLLLCVANAADWNYHDDKGPATWMTTPAFPSCAGQRQSPVNIEIPNTVYTKDLSQFDRSLFEVPVSGKYYNNGHTVGINFDGWTIPAGQGDFTDSYQVANLHMHWGTTSSGGSEHTFNNELAFAELHFVHFNTKYGTIGNAVDKSDGLAVLGVMVLARGNVDNPAFQQLMDPIAAGDLTYKGNETLLASINFGNLFPTSTSMYYRYLGSLTTPGCLESVTWTVFNDVIVISESQAEKLSTSLYEYDASKDDNKLIHHNFRPTRPLHGRKVYRSQRGEVQGLLAGGASSPLTNLIVLIASILFSGLFINLF